LIAHDGKSNWFEGIMLIAVYIIVAVGFFYDLKESILISSFKGLNKELIIKATVLRSLEKRSNTSNFITPKAAL
jgi:hypothetical protein